MGFLYRTRQFWSALTAIPSEEDLALAGRVLTPAQLRLFQQMQPGEQAHSLAILRQLISAGETNPDLWVAALLHDCGKSCHPLRIWERVAIVVAGWLAPDRVKIWSRGDPSGWKRAFVVAENHPQWGAHLAAEAGVSPTVVELILHHQERPVRSVSGGKVEKLLVRLQNLDNER